MAARRSKTQYLPPLWFLSFALSLLASPGTAQSHQPGKSYALLIGAGDYRNWPPLVNPIPDVRALAEELRQHYGFLPELLENPDRMQLLANLRRYAELEYGPQDQLLIVFAGHGTYDEVTRLGYLAAVDSAGRGSDPTFSTLIPYPNLLALIENIPCRQILLVVDACYSGSLGQERLPGAVGSGPEQLAQRWQHKSRRFLTSGGKEYVSDGEPGKHTPFIERLLTGLRAPGNDGVLTLEELQAGFMSRLEPKPHWGSFGGDEGKGGFFFFVRGPATRPGTIPTVSTAVQTPLPSVSSQSKLRAEPARLTQQQLTRSLQKLGLFHVDWSPEGDFENELRLQEEGIWEVVVDLESNLTWQQAGSEVQLSRMEADAYVARLNAESHAGYSNWRLPTFEELASLLEPEAQGNGLFIKPVFAADQDTCWSADQDQGGGSSYYVSFNTGGGALGDGRKRFFVRAVRTP